MPKKPPPEYTHWKPGQSGNPSGRPPLPPEVKEAKRLNKATLETIVNTYLFMPLELLRGKLEDRSLPAVECWMISIIYKGLMSGDWGGFEWIAQRLVGKVKETIEVSAVVPYLIHRPSGEVLELGVKKEELPE